MSEQATQPAVLDYAANLRRPAVYFVRFYAALLLWILLGGAAGWMVSPTLYRSVGSFQILSFVQLADPHTDSADVQKNIRTNMEGLYSAAHLEDTSNRLRAKGMHITPAELAGRVFVSHEPKTTVISVAATDHDPEVAESIVTEMLAGFPLGVSTRNIFGSNAAQLNVGGRAQRLRYAQWFWIAGALAGLGGWLIARLYYERWARAFSQPPRARVIDL